MEATLAAMQTGAARVARTMASHGSDTTDVIIVNFADKSSELCRLTRAAGALAIQCNHGGGHCSSSTALRETAWKFLKDHPFGLAIEPYASGLPASFPSYCTSMP